MIRLEEVSLSYDRGVTHAVSSLSLQVADGELLALVGGSGCGKTTTLKMINRLIDPTHGTIFVRGSDVQTIDPVTLRRGIGYVIQGIGLFGHMTVGQNVAIVPRLLGQGGTELAERVDQMLETVGLEPESYRARFPSTLSGGQQQRVGVARALAAGARILLMDEPFGALDAITRDGLQRELARLRGELGLTIILVTHDMSEALRLADRVAVMQAGRLLRLATPTELFADPGDGYVSELLDVPRRQAAEIHRRIGTP